MFHAGTGPTHLNAFLTCMNFPPVSHTTLNRRQAEAGAAMEKVARESCKEVVAAERQAQIAENGCASAETTTVDLSVI